MSVIHLKKKDIVKSKVRGVEIEFDHEKLATILGIPGNNGISFGVPLVIKKGEEPKKYDFFEDTFLTMCKLTRENGIWWIGSGENRRRDNDGDAPEGNRDRERSFMIVEEDARGSPEALDEIPAEATPSSAQQKDKGIAGVDPSGPTSREAEFLKFQAEFERKRANRFHDDLEKAKAENARLLALLHQAQTKPHP
ncbi:hypothetical protein Dimus_010492 [Dionaea muscipula]